MYEQLRSLNSGEIPLDRMILEIKRVGTGTATTYQLLPTANGVLTEAQEAKIAQTPLIDLSGASHEEPEKEELLGPIIDGRYLGKSGAGGITSSGIDFEEAPF